MCVYVYIIYNNAVGMQLWSKVLLRKSHEKMKEVFYPKHVHIINHFCTK